MAIIEIGEVWLVYVKPMRNDCIALRGHREGKYIYYGKPTHDDIGRVITEGMPWVIGFVPAVLRGSWPCATGDFNDCVSQHHAID